MVVKIVLNQVGVQLLDPRAWPGGKSAVQHRSLRLNSLRLSFPTSELYRQPYMDNLPLSELTTPQFIRSTRWPIQGLVSCQDSQIEADAVVDFSQDRNLTMLSASIDPGNPEIKVCNVFRCQTLAVIHENVFPFIITP